MDRELSWPNGRTAGLEDRLRVGRVSGLPIDAGNRRGTLEQALAFAQMEEDRRISTAGAFLMFMFGFGCGAFWTILLTWLI